MIAACAIGVGATWIGVLLAYDSADWGSGHDALPVSFFIVAVIFVTYLVCGLLGARSRSARPHAISDGAGEGGTSSMPADASASRG